MRTNEQVNGLILWIEMIQLRPQLKNRNSIVSKMTVNKGRRKTTHQEL